MDPSQDAVTDAASTLLGNLSDTLSNPSPSDSLSEWSENQLSNQLSNHKLPEAVLAHLDGLKWDNQGLIPAVIQDYLDGTVLMMAWMNRSSLQKTLETGQTWFWSRSRQQLWPKGETSGHIQKVQAIRFDCDQDCLLVQVEQVGDVACHTGSRSCFFGGFEVYESGIRLSSAPTDQSDQKHKLSTLVGDTLSQVFAVVKQRQADPQPESYTNKLLAKGDNAILKKLGEETAEVVMAVKDKDPVAIASEVADLWYHCLVALAHHQVDLKDVYRQLQTRRSRTQPRQ